MRVLITGVAGAGGSYLAEYVLKHHPEVEVHGIVRSLAAMNPRNLRNVREKLHLHQCDLTSFSEVQEVLGRVKPDLIHHLASNANVRASFDAPVLIMQNNIQGTHNLLEAIRLSGDFPRIHICSTSEVYGMPTKTPIDEDAKIAPLSPYAISKTTQDMLGDLYYRAYSLPIVRTRMFTYLNPRRADLFATSFCLQVARIEAGKQDAIRHGNLDSIRTIVDVRDAVRSFWIALEEGRPGEVYNIGGTTTMSVREFLELVKTKTSCTIKTILDEKLLRPVDVSLQIPDVSKFLKETSWRPHYSFDQSVEFLLDECRAWVKEEC